MEVGEQVYGELEMRMRIKVHEPGAQGSRVWRLENEEG